MSYVFSSGETLSVVHSEFSRADRERRWAHAEFNTDYTSSALFESAVASACVCVCRGTQNGGCLESLYTLFAAVSCLSTLSLCFIHLLLSFFILFICCGCCCFACLLLCVSGGALFSNWLRSFKSWEMRESMSTPELRSAGYNISASFSF